MTNESIEQGGAAQKAAGNALFRQLRYIAYLLLIALCLALIALYRMDLLPGAPVERASALFGLLRAGTPEGFSAKETGDFEKRLKSLEARMDELEKAVTDGSVEPGRKEETGEELSSIKAEMESLSSAVSSLQMQLKRNANETGAFHDTVKARTAMLAAFIRLNSAIEIGADFSSQLRDLSRAAAKDQAIIAAIMRMEPHAKSGVASFSELRDGFASLSVPLMVEIRKAGADTWKERVLAELQRIVSIRPLHGKKGGDATLDEIEKDLAARRLKDALEKVNSLPEPARKILENWRARAEARLAVDSALSAVSAVFLESVNTGGEAAKDGGPSSAAAEE